MRGSKKTSVNPTTRAQRSADLHAAVETGELSVIDILEVARQVTDAHIARTQQEAEAAQAKEPQPLAKGKPAGAFNLKRALTQQGAASPLFDEPWRDQTTEGPADLIRHFAIAALTEYKPEIARFDEDSYALIMDVAEFAVNTALRMAGVSESWADEYRELTAHLRK